VRFLIPILKIEDSLQTILVAILEEEDQISKSENIC
jgi:hypothetical protein